MTETKLTETKFPNPLGPNPLGPNPLGLTLFRDSFFYGEEKRLLEVKRFCCLAKEISIDNYKLIFFISYEKTVYCRLNNIKE